MTMIKKSIPIIFCLATITIMMSQPVSAQDPYADMLVSSFQRTCDDITAGINQPGQRSIKLRANCLKSDNHTINATSIDLRGVQRVTDRRSDLHNRVFINPLYKRSSNLTDCSIIGTEQDDLGVYVSINCEGVQSLLNVTEITNNDGHLNYEVEKILRLAVQEYDDPATRQRFRNIIHDIENDIADPRVMFKNSTKREGFILLDLGAENEPALLVYSDTIPFNDGSQEIYVLSYIYDNKNQANLDYNEY